MRRRADFARLEEARAEKVKSAARRLDALEVAKRWRGCLIISSTLSVADTIRARGVRWMGRETL